MNGSGFGERKSSGSASGRRLVCGALVGWLMLALVGIRLVGLPEMLRTESFHDGFAYPMEIDLQQVARARLSKEPVVEEPINRFPASYVLQSTRCRRTRFSDRLHFLVAVKSAVRHFARRDAIRRSWAQISGTRNAPRFLTLFFLGSTDDADAMAAVANESARYDDVIVGSFVDDYLNNTYKLMMEFQWVSENCARRSEFVMFLDDDYYLDPRKLQERLRELGHHATEELLLGYSYMNPMPNRRLFSKWYRSVDQYKFSRYPPYPTGGSFVVAMKLVRLFAVASEYVQFLPFDDVFVGIVARKLGYFPAHDHRFSPEYVPYYNDHFQHLIACHGYHDAQRLTDAWRYRNSPEVASYREL